MGPTEFEQQGVPNTPLKKFEAQFFNPNSVVDAPSPSSSHYPQNISASQRALRSEALRLATFQGWPLIFMLPRLLSSSGFFYRGIGDQAQCAFCCITISQWEQSDDPMTEHRRYAPNCPFVLNLPVGNIPLSSSRQAPAPVTDSVSQPPRQPLMVPMLSGGIDTCSRFQNETRPNALPEQAHALTIRPQEDSEGSLSCLVPHQQACHPELSSMEARLATFADWPPGLAQRPSQLAEAGFYYIKTGDHVKCFCCDGALRNWEPKDDPWEEHGRWFSRCNYLLSVKGVDFAKSLQHREKSIEPVVENKAEIVSEPKIRDSLLCQICYDQQLSMVFLPCGHSISCPSCATALSTCPLCRKRIEATVRAYFPFT